MGVNPILLKSRWDARGKYELQVLPHPKNPGVFIARIIARAQGMVQPGVHELWQQVGSCRDISALHVFIESQDAANQTVALKPADAPVIVPADLSQAFQSAVFPDGLEHFLIQPGTLPDEPVYPVWTRDITRSMQVVEGKYSEIIPLTFEFIPTLNCIFRCIQCSYREPKEQLGIWKRNIFSPAFHMDKDTMMLLLEKLKDGGVNDVLFTGGGEPLLSKSTPNAMRYAHDVLGMRVGLYTNGALVTGDKARDIIAAKPAFVRVSLNAGQREAYLKHHRPLKGDKKIDYFLNAQRGIELLAKMKAELQSETVLGVSYLVGPDNAQDVVNGARLIAQLARKYRGMINYMRFTPSVNYFGDEQHPRDLFERILAEIEKEALPMLKDAGVDARVYFHRFRGLHEPRTYDQCLAAGWYGGIGPGGILYWCCEKLFNQSFAFGSLLDSSLPELWSGEERKRVIDLVSRAVKREADSPCPVVCKPHEHNKVFAKIEKLRRDGKIEIAKVWLMQIHDIIAYSQRHVNARLDGFAS